VTRAFPTAGTFHYVCAFHPQNMKGTVVVTAPTY
jgi:plastocyanin